MVGIKKRLKIENVVGLKKDDDISLIIFSSSHNFGCTKLKNSFLILRVSEHFIIS